MADPIPQQQLERFLAKCEPAIARQADEAIAIMRRRQPGAFELT